MSPVSTSRIVSSKYTFALPLVTMNISFSSDGSFTCSNEVVFALRTQYAPPKGKGARRRGAPAAARVAREAAARRHDRDAAGLAHRLAHRREAQAPA